MKNTSYTCPEKQNKLEDLRSSRFIISQITIQWQTVNIGNSTILWNKPHLIGEYSSEGGLTYDTLGNEEPPTGGKGKFSLTAVLVRGYMSTLDRAYRPAAAVLSQVNFTTVTYRGSEHITQRQVIVFVLIATLVDST